MITFIMHKEWMIEVNYIVILLYRALTIIAFELLILWESKDNLIYYNNDYE